MSVRSSAYLITILRLAGVRVLRARMVSGLTGFLSRKSGGACGILWLHWARVSSDLSRPQRAGRPPKPMPSLVSPRLIPTHPEKCRIRWNNSNLIIPVIRQQKHQAVQSYAHQTRSHSGRLLPDVVAARGDVVRADDFKPGDSEATRTVIPDSGSGCFANCMTSPVAQARDKRADSFSVKPEPSAAL
ncbi:protein of unknown function (plasmid) [Cupriavidus taiwanensis]|nr:protein of unknown function [Cupriavidus taiwanensis]